MNETRARALLGDALRLTERAAADVPSADRLELELACDEVETKLIKRERCRHAVESTEIELAGACTRLGAALARLREALRRRDERSPDTRTPNRDAPSRDERKPR